jgi:hypothetical protein
MFTNIDYLTSLANLNDFFSAVEATIYATFGGIGGNFYWVWMAIE